MRRTIALLVLVIALLPLLPSKAATSASSPDPGTGVSAAYAVKVTAPPNPGVEVTAVYSDVVAPLRLTIGTPTYAVSLEYLTDLRFTTPAGEPLAYRQVDARTVEVAGGSGSVVAHYAQNLEKAQARGDKVAEIGGKLNGYESLLVPDGQPLAAAKIRFDLPNGWSMVSAYPQDGEWSVLQPYAFGDLAWEIQVGAWFFGIVDFDETRSYDDGFKIRVVNFQGQDYRNWNLYLGHSARDEALAYADFYDQSVQYYTNLFGEYPFSEMLLVGPGFWQGGASWKVQGLRGMVEAEAVTHHVLHAYFSTWPGRLSPWGANWVLLREGFTSYAEGIHTAEITGDPFWRGMLYDRKFLYSRARQFGNTQQNSWQYVAGPIVTFMADDRIRKATGGQKGIEELMALLWRNYKDVGPVQVTDEMLLQALKELTGEDWTGFYESYILRTDHLEISAMDRVKPDFPAYLKTVSDLYYNGHPSAYFVNAELVAATGDLDMGIRMQSPYLTFSRAHKTLGQFAIAARQQKDLATADLTEADIAAVLKQVTGKEHSDFFSYYRGLGFTVDPADISEFVRTFSSNREASDNHVRLSARQIPVGGEPVTVEAEMVDPAWTEATEYLLSVNVYDLPTGLSDGAELIGGDGVCLEGIQVWKEQDFGDLTQYNFRLPRIVRDGKTLTHFTLNLPVDAGVVTYQINARFPDGNHKSDALTPLFHRVPGGAPAATPPERTLACSAMGTDGNGGNTGPGGNTGAGGTVDGGSGFSTSSAVKMIAPDATPGAPSEIIVELADPDLAATESQMLQLNIYEMPGGVASLQELVTGNGVAYQHDQSGVEGPRGPMTQAIFHLTKRVTEGKSILSFTLHLPEDAGQIDYILNAGPENQPAQYQELLPINVLPATSVRFKDVPASHLFHGEIDELGRRGIVAPDAAGNFRPSENLTRADLSRWLVQAAGASLDVPDPGFADVGSTHPAYRYIAAARAARIINGYEDGTFRPDAPVTRAQMAAIIVRAFGLQEPTSEANGFSDVPPGTPLRSEIMKLSGAGITKGYPDGTFHPDEFIARGQAAAFVVRALRLQPLFASF